MIDLSLVMGRLAIGKVLNWKETKQHSLFVRRNAARQFLKLHQKHKDRKCDKFRWGDEVSVLRLGSGHRYTVSLLTSISYCLIIYRLSSLF